MLLNIPSKFRGYSYTSGYIFGDLNIYENGDAYITEWENSLSFAVELESVSIFTGCISQNNEEVYTGDVIIGIFKDEDGSIVDFIDTVIWNEELFAMTLKTCKRFLYSVQVESVVH